MGAFGWGLLPEGPQARAYNPPPQGVPANMGSAIRLAAGHGAQQRGERPHHRLRLLRRESEQAREPREEEPARGGAVPDPRNVTEFNEVAEATGSSTGGSLGGLGAGPRYCGAIAGNTPAAVTGAGVALANPTFENTKARRTGSVADGYQDRQSIERAARTAAVVAKRELHQRVGGERVFTFRRRQGRATRSRRVRWARPIGRHELGHDPDRRPATQRALTRRAGSTSDAARGIRGSRPPATCGHAPCGLVAKAIRSPKRRRRMVMKNARKASMNGRAPKLDLSKPVKVPQPIAAQQERGVRHHR